MARLAQGRAEDLLSSIFSAIGKVPTILFPAMNTKMLINHLTQENYEKLNSLPHVFIHPTDEGELACGEIGSGKLPPVETVAMMGTDFNLLTKNHRHIVITAGSTHSPLDPVRYITNPASGLTGKEIARTFLQHGHKVTFVCGEHNKGIIQNLIQHPHLKIITGVTTQDIFNKIKTLLDCDIYISAAAFSDISLPAALQK